MKWYNAFDFMPTEPAFYLVAVRECGELGLSKYVTTAAIDESGDFYWWDGDKKRLNGDDFYVLFWAVMPEFPEDAEES